MQTDFKLNPIPIGTTGKRGMVAADPMQRQQAALATDPTGKPLPPVGAADATATVDHEQLDKAVQRLSDYVQQVKRELKFSVDEDSGRTIITVINADTNEVVRQIPPEEVLTLAHNLDSGEVSFLEAKA